MDRLFRHQLQSPSQWRLLEPRMNGAVGLSRAADLENKPIKTRKTVFILGAFVLFALLPFYYCAWRAPGVGLSHDDGIYLVTAKALATGKGYAIISLPREIRQTKYPVLFPLLLSGVWRINPEFPSNVPLLKLIPLLATALWMWAVYRLAREFAADREWALLLTACVAANQWVLSFSGMLRPENLFGALATWSLVFLLRAERNGQLRPALWAALLISAAYHTRTAALPLIAGGCLGLLLARRYAPLLAFGAGSSALCLPWMIWQAGQSVLPPVERYYTSVCYAQENILTYFSAHEKVVILRENLLQLLIAPSYFFGLTPGLAAFAACLLFWGICVVGAMRTKSRCVQFALIASVFTPALWSWQPARFIFPSLGILLVAGAANRSRAAMVSIGALLAASLISLGPVWRDFQRTQFFLAEFRPYPATWPEMADTLGWVRLHSSPGDTVVSAVDPMIYLWTGLKSVRGFYADPLPVYYGLPAHANSDSEFLRVLRQYHPRYVVRMHPDFYEDVFLKQITDRLLKTGVLSEVHRPGRCASMKCEATRQFDGMQRSRGFRGCTMGFNMPGWRNRQTQRT